MKQNVKYAGFIIIIFITGIGFFHREELERQLNLLFRLGIEGYEDALQFPGREEPEEAAVSGGDAKHADTTLSGGNADKNEQSLSWEYFTADESYFDDAVFIGDSRTVGLYDYAGLDNATFYASTGLTVYKLFDAKIVEKEESRQKGTIEEALSEKQFAKIYLMIGINEMGTGTVESFAEKYKEVVAHLQELQPNAVIYLQAIMKVSGERSGKGDYINNEGIVLRNEEIAKLADNQKIFYLDVNPSITDESGGLVKEYTFDGVHLKAKYIVIWKQFLMEHAVKFY